MRLPAIPERMTAPATPPPKPPAFNVAAFGRLAAAGDRRALAMLREVLKAIEQGRGLAPTLGGDAQATLNICRRLADGIQTLFAHPDLEITPEDCDWLAHGDQHLAAVLRLARPSAPRRIARRVAAAHGYGGRINRPGPKLANVLAVSGIASGAAVDWPVLLAVQPETALPFFLANFTHRALFDGDAARRRDALIALAPSLGGKTLRATAMPALSQAWMLCTYASAPGRHDLKPALNVLVRGMLQREGIVARPLPERGGASRGKPTLAVVSETLFAEHAIFKTYAHFLRQLRRRFRLVLVTIAGYADDAAKALFDEVIAPKWPPGVAWSSEFFLDLVPRVEVLKPDVVYYPAVGLSAFTVALCNLRLAPLQIASVGHPATTRSPEIDAMVMGHAYFADPALFSERVLVLRSSGALFQPHAGETPPAVSVRDDPDVVRVAIPATPMKINAGFLDMLGRVAKASGRRVEYRFFPNLSGVRHLDCARQIGARLAGARVFPRLDHDRFMAALADCDARFGTYPFGGANTGVDGFLAGLPTLVAEGPEPSSRTDSRLIRLFDLPDWLIAEDGKSYEKAALRLIADDKTRARLARKILAAGPEGVLFSAEQQRYPTDFVDAVWWLHEHRERVMASDKRAWTDADRRPPKARAPKAKAIGKPPKRKKPAAKKPKARKLKKKKPKKKKKK